MNERVIMRAVLAIAMGVICALLAAFWRLARTSSVDQAVMTGGTVFVGAVMVAFVVLTYLRSD